MNLLKKIFYPNHIEFALKEVRELLEQDWNLIVGGSVALYLQGKKLKRFKNWTGDIDLITTQKTEINLEETKDLPSGCDFEVQGKLGDRKVDVRVDTNAKFNEIWFKGYIYRVSPIDIIIEAKKSYNREKDINDLTELGYETK